MRRLEQSGAGAAPGLIGRERSVDGRPLPARVHPGGRAARLSVDIRPLVGTMLAVLGSALSPTTAAGEMPRIAVHGDRLYAGAEPWRAWGMNWGVGDHAPVDRLASTTPELRTSRFSVPSFGSARDGAPTPAHLSSARAGDATPSTHAPSQTLAALRRLLALAQSDHVYLDITGDLVWQPARAPAWYARMRWQARWRVQARFWKAVAQVASGSPAVLC